MCNSLLHIGSVIDYSEKQLMIVGYGLKKADDKYCLIYLAVPFPLGYTSADSVKEISVADYKVLFKGYETDAYQMVSKYMDIVVSILSHGSGEEVIKQIQGMRMSNYEGKDNER